MTHRKKPLIEMSLPELERTFDLMGMETDRQILEDARDGRAPDCVLAVAILESSAGVPMVAYAVCEYGDGDGTELVDGFIRGCKANRLLREGELLYRRLMKVTAWVDESRKPEEAA